VVRGSWGVGETNRRDTFGVRGWGGCRIGESPRSAVAGKPATGIRNKCTKT
jgi:hypothetical protein